MWFLFKNVWKAVWSNKVHFFSLILLIVASLSVSWGLLSAETNLDISYNNFLNASTPAQFMINLNSSASFFKSIPDSLEDQKKFIKTFNQNLNNKNIELFINYRDERLFTYKNNILLAIGNPEGYQNLLPFDNNTVSRVIGTSNQSSLTLKSDQIFVEKNFAFAHGWNIGDKLTNIFSENTTYHLLGNAISYDFSYPLLSPINIVASTSSNGVIYVSPQILYNDDPSKARLTTVSSADRTQLLLARFKNPNQYTKDKLNEVSEALKKTYTDLNFAIPSDIEHYGICASYYHNVYFPERITAYQSFIKFSDLASDFLSGLIIIVSCFVIATVTRKRIEEDNDSILTFKALGYSKSAILLPYSIYPIAFSLFLFIVSLFVSYGFQALIYSIFSSMFTIPIVAIGFNYVSFLVNITLITFVFVLAAFMSTWLTLRKIAKGI